MFCEEHVVLHSNLEIKLSHYLQYIILNIIILNIIQSIFQKVDLISKNLSDTSRSSTVF
jgi:hypothetical protein